MKSKALRILYNTVNVLTSYLGDDILRNKTDFEKIEQYRSYSYYIGGVHSLVKSHTTQAFVNLKIRENVLIKYFL